MQQKSLNKKTFRASLFYDYYTYIGKEQININKLYNSSLKHIYWIFQNIFKFHFVSNLDNLQNLWWRASKQVNCLSKVYLMGQQFNLAPFSLNQLLVHAKRVR